MQLIPGVVKARSRSEAMIQSIDFLPTLAEAVGAKLPAEQKLDGRSFLPVLRGKATTHRDIIFTFFPHHTPASSQVPACSVRRGDWQLIRYFHDALIAAFPSDAKTVPPTYKYFVGIVVTLRNMKPESLTSKSVLVGSTQKIIDDLKQIEASGISEVILYFNYGLKPHAMVREQMQRFMTDIAPHFDTVRNRLKLVAAQ